jgi:hypothetical protein
MAVTVIPRHGTTEQYAQAEANGKIYEKYELLLEETATGLALKVGDGVNPYSKLKVLAQTDTSK